MNNFQLLTALLKAGANLVNFFHIPCNKSDYLILAFACLAQ